LKRHNLLIMSDLVGSSVVQRLRRFANVYRSSELDEKTLADRLREADALLISSWPKILTEETLRSMKRLRFIQGILVGVDHIPFRALARKVVVCSNAGAYSLEVGEHAFALLLSAAKRVVDTHNSVAKGKTDFNEFRGAADDILVLRGKTLGVVGYGGIGAVVAGLGRSFGMNVIALSRSKRDGRGIRFVRGRGALTSLLASSDAVVLALPLTNLTEGMIGAKELSSAKRGAVLVNISRGDIVDQAALYEHLTGNPGFRYATDVWWYKEGRESLVTDHPFTSLPNFVGTPHISGPTALASGRPVKMAVENTLRHLRGLRPKNVVRRSEYLTPR
jgi:D-3-phosphoglycerate dehydrogenase / 2-oxoglutarate reductase